MTLSEIQALPVQTNNRLRYATDAQQLFVVLRGSDGSAAIPVGVGTNNTITVADAAARKTLTSYDATGGPVPGTTKVSQVDDPDSIWNLVAEDVTLDDSWVGQPTLNPAGEIEGPIIARTSEAGDIPGEGEIVRSDGVLAIGDNETEQGIRMLNNITPYQLAPQRPDEVTVYYDANVATHAQIFLGAKTSTGYMAFQDPTGLVTVEGFGIDSIAVSLAWTIPADGAPWGGRALKKFSFWPCDADGNPSGNYIADGTAKLAGNDIELLGVSFSGTSWSRCVVPVYMAVSIEAWDMSMITSITLTGEFTGLGAPNLQWASIGNCPALTSVVIWNSTDIKNLSMATGLPSLVTLQLTNMGMKTLKLPGNVYSFFEINDGDLEELDGGGMTSSVTAKLNNLALTTDALYRFLTTTGTNTAMEDLELEGNPCDNAGALAEGVAYTAAETAALATAKNWNLVFVAS